jgi:glutamate-5-semialdehyde dehydrogenase
MKKSIELQIKQTREAANEFAKLSYTEKRQVLISLAQELRGHQDEILAANTYDVIMAKKAGESSAFIDRLTLTEKGFSGMLDQLQTVITLSDSAHEIIEEKLLPNGITLQKMRFPLGVILMIYESRPNVTIDVTGLCLMSGNVVILKGGSESIRTNKALVACIHRVLERFALSPAAVMLLTKISHEEMGEVLQRNDLIDLVIPRGSYGLTTAVAKQSRIPILYHAAGGARMYIDTSAAVQKAIEICVNAKTNRTGVCNALDAVLIHKDIAEKILPELAIQLHEKGFAIRADAKACKYMKHATLATGKDFQTEFLDSILAVKIVNDADEAIDFIKENTHGHTEVLVAEEKKVIDAFITEIDAAGLMINCSSRLHDGGEFGMGAEMGTATGKFHARGPVGIRELTTYKWIAYGNGQIKQ